MKNKPSEEKKVNKHSLFYLGGKLQRFADIIADTEGNINWNILVDELQQIGEMLKTYETIRRKYDEMF